MDLTSLPHEIQIQVFEELVDFNINECQCVSKSWLALAQPTMYKSVSLGGDSMICSFLETVSTSNYRPGRYVKNLDIYYSFLESVDERGHSYGDNALWYAERVFERIAAYTPNLQALETPLTSSYLWRTIQRIQSKGHWKFLKNLSCPQKSEELEDYIDLVISMKDKIEQVSIFPEISVHTQSVDELDIFWNLDSDFYRTNYRKILRHLPQFTRLKSIDIVMDESMWIHQLDECINACQTNVERLEIDSSFVDSPDDASETSNIVPNQTILYLSFTGRFFSEKDLVYIMDKFVSLKELHISCEPSLFRSHSSFSFGSATLLRLGCYLKTLNKFSIRGLSFKKMSHFIRIVHDIAVEGDTTIDTKIAKSFEKVAHKSVSLRYSRGKTSEFSITSHIYSSDIAKEEVDLPFAYQRLTELSLIEETSVNSEMFPGILSIDTKYRIDGILKNCTRLKKLYINNVFFASPAPPIFNHSIECLVFINYNCDPLHLEQLLAQLPNVKALTLSNSFIDSGENETPKFKINLEHNQLDELTFDTLGSNGFSLKIATPTDTVNFRFAKSLQQIPKLGRPDIHIILGHVKKVNLDPNSRRPLRVVL